MIHEAILCLGSNTPCRRQAVEEAISRLATVARIESRSGECFSPDISGRGGEYLNVAVRCLTDLPLDEFSRCLSHFERLGGRLPESKSSGVMPIDIDLIVWDKAVVSPADHARPYFQAALSTL
ncbi:MAG: 2-amino-4-hydroxy-6-hydroxymethyldihydropteridine diphosphokinase [Muribaculaceae bacterium]|nr:2-amino-4-hydroxy-6-hydroxymethyldihydropteridine diphosphokinase [Muribaculaceae bacterium]